MDEKEDLAGKVESDTIYKAVRLKVSGRKSVQGVARAGLARIGQRGGGNLSRNKNQVLKRGKPQIDTMQMKQESRTGEL